MTCYETYYFKEQQEKTGTYFFKELQEKTTKPSLFKINDPNSGESHHT